MTIIRPGGSYTDVNSVGFLDNVVPSSSYCCCCLNCAIGLLGPGGRAAGSQGVVAVDGAADGLDVVSLLSAGDGRLSCMAILADDLLPDQLWAIVDSLLPMPPRPRYGCRRRTIPDRNCFAAIVYMAHTSTTCAVPLPFPSSMSAAGGLRRTSLFVPDRDIVGICG
jgi:hypothetical protein